MSVLENEAAEFPLLKRFLIFLENQAGLLLDFYVNIRKRGSLPKKAAF